MKIIEKNGRLYRKFIDSEIEVTKEEILEHQTRLNEMDDYLNKGINYFNTIDLKIEDFTNLNNTIKVDRFCENLQKGLQKLYDTNNEIEIINEILEILKQGVKTDISHPLKKDLKEINTYLRNKIKEIRINKTIKQATKRHEHIFSNNGFMLFKYLLDNFIKEKRGRNNDVLYCYWKLYNAEPKQIHQGSTVFLKWFNEEYDEESDIIQNKTLNEVKSKTRDNHYSMSLELFNQQK